jgi:hypothetical protein
MAKQWTELETLTIPKGKRESNATSLHPRTGTIATLTVYASNWDAQVYVSSDGTEFVPFVHKGQDVKIRANSACDVPLPACKLMRLESTYDADEDHVFKVLALLEVD